MNTFAAQTLTIIINVIQVIFFALTADFVEITSHFFGGVGGGGGG